MVGIELTGMMRRAIVGAWHISLFEKGQEMHGVAVPAWNAHYPGPQRLREEVNAVAEAFSEVLIEEIPGREIRGIYLKGSGQKEWDSPIDYVPEVSDVDIHIEFRNGTDWQQYVGTVSQAMAIQHKVELRYLSKVNQAVHAPRPQLVIVNKLISDLEFVHSPRSTVKVLFGAEYPLADYGDPDRIRRGDCNRLLEAAAYLTDFPLNVIDRPGKYVLESLRPLVWRVSPAGPRVLHLSGIDTQTAWGVNRTKVVWMLAELGQPDLARHYAGFYLSAWEYFLSRFESADAGRSALKAGVEVLTAAAEVASDWLASHPTS